MNDTKLAHFGNISHNFKITTVILLFFLIIARLTLLFYSNFSDIISDKVLLSIVAFIVLYLWIQETRDYHNLLRLNKALVDSHESLKEAEIATIASLIKTVEAKDRYTSGHSERVTRIALAIADEMSLNDEAKGIIGRAGMLHDIGKIGLKDEVLLKTEKLSDEDWSIIKEHPEQGAKILEPLKFLARVKDVIISHHERYDGKGYPGGAKADNIPLEAQVLAVADAFDAMNSHRAYRKSLARETVLSELKKNRGMQHSPKVVDAFLKVLEKNPDLWEK